MSELDDHKFNTAKYSSFSVKAEKLAATPREQALINELEMVEDALEGVTRILEKQGEAILNKYKGQLLPRRAGYELGEIATATTKAREILLKPSTESTNL